MNNKWIEAETLYGTKILLTLDKVISATLLTIGKGEYKGQTACYIEGDHQYYIYLKGTEYDRILAILYDY